MQSGEKNGTFQVKKGQVDKKKKIQGFCSWTE